MPIHTLTAEQVRRRCDPASFSFETTAELPYTDDIFGQPRGTRAIDFGVNMDAPGYNLFVLGPAGTGRTTAIQRYLRKTAPNAAQSRDWVYVHNFADPRRPVALCLSQGKGKLLRDAMDGLIAQIQRRLLAVFETEAYDDAADSIASRLRKAQNDELETLQAEATPLGFNLIQTAAGLAITPIASATPSTVPTTTTADQQAAHAKLNESLDDAVRRIREMEKVAREALNDLDAQVARSIAHPFISDVLAQVDDLAEQEPHQAAIKSFLAAVREDIVGSVNVFKPVARGGLEIDPAARRMYLNRYRVNVFVDNCETCGAPIEIEDYPVYYNMVGRVDRALTINSNPTMGSTIDHMMLRSGALHRANGGYLLLRARDVLSEGDSWSALKRCLMKNSITIEEPNSQTQIISGPTLEPQSIPLSVKVILHGTNSEYWAASHDEDFPIVVQGEGRVRHQDGAHAGQRAGVCVVLAQPHGRRKAHAV